jgi:DNA-binding HxlR family transcriptional regulator
MAKTKSACQTLSLLHLIGKKWTIPIVELFTPGNKKLQFGTMQQLLVNITPKNLSKSLKELYDAKIIQKVGVRQNGLLHTQYSLTTQGAELEQFIISAKRLGIALYSINEYCVKRKCYLCPLSSP